MAPAQALGHASTTEARMCREGDENLLTGALRLGPLAVNREPSELRASPDPRVLLAREDPKLLVSSNQMLSARGTDLSLDDQLVSKTSWRARLEVGEQELGREPDLPRDLPAYREN